MKKYLIQLFMLVLVLSTISAANAVGPTKEGWNVDKFFVTTSDWDLSLTSNGLSGYHDLNIWVSDGTRISTNTNAMAYSLSGDGSRTYHQYLVVIVKTDGKVTDIAIASAASKIKPEK